MTDYVLEVESLTRHYRVADRPFRPPIIVKALNEVTFRLEAGKTLAVVGESGCGKSTLARALTLVETPTSGHLRIDGKDVAQLSPHQRKRFRRCVQMVFQNPYASLNPRRKIGDQLAEPLLINTDLNRTQRREKVHQMLQQTGLRPEHAQRYPHMFSGGQRQRIAIARSMMLQPRILVADEPTSALDVSIQAQMLNLLMDLQEAYGTAYVLISHDLSVVRHMADVVMVMYLGRIVEIGPANALYQNPLHPYTQILMSAAPTIASASFERKTTIAGEPPNPLSPPPGCHFHPRCPYATERCRQQAPELRPLDLRHVACHHSERLAPH